MSSTNPAPDAAQQQLAQRIDAQLRQWQSYGLVPSSEQLTELLIGQVQASFQPLLYAWLEPSGDDVAQLEFKRGLLATSVGMIEARLVQLRGPRVRSQ